MTPDREDLYDTANNAFNDAYDGAPDGGGVSAALRHVVDCILAELPATRQGEAVAWRVRWASNGPNRPEIFSEWRGMEVLTDEDRSQYDTHGAVVEYAYAAPVVSEWMDAVEAVRTLAEGWNAEAKAEGFGGGNTRAKEILALLPQPPATQAKENPNDRSE